MIPVYKPYLTKKSFSYATDAFKSTWISSTGKYILEVEEKLQELLNAKHVITCNTGSSACHIMSRAMKEFYPSKTKIKAPNNVYVAAVNGFLTDRHHTLLNQDCSLDTWNIDESTLSNEDEIVLIVHNIGNIINVPKLKRLYPNTIFLEDNCEGFLGQYENKMSGTAALCSAISFFGNKNITCGEGGAFITDNDDIYEYSKLMRGQGQSSTRFVHNELGYNYRLTNVQAAILKSQLELLPEILERKTEIFEKYRLELGQLEHVNLQKIEENTKHSNWMFGFRLDREKSKGYGHLETFFKERNIEVRPMFYPMSRHKFLKEEKLMNFGIEDNAKLVNETSVILPSFPGLTKKEQKTVINTVKEYLVT